MTDLAKQHQSCLGAREVVAPYGPLSADSRFYIERPPLEAQADAEIAKPGCLVRLKAPRQMGKSSLLLRLANRAAALEYAVCMVDFLQADAQSFTSLDALLRWFASNVARQLGLSANLDDYWDADIGSKVSCTIYFEHRLLNPIAKPVVLLLNEVNRVFRQGEVAADFFSLLRSWHEQTRRSPLWQNLRLVMAYSSDVYIPLKLEQSPFNVGMLLRLPEFTPAQVRSLADRYDLRPETQPAVKTFLETLLQRVGGHPYLVHLAIAQLAAEPASHASLLAEAKSPRGIYTDHLRHCLMLVRQQPELVAALRAMLEVPDGLWLSSDLAYQLDSLGLVHLEGQHCQFSCDLYRQFFQAELGGVEGPSGFHFDQLLRENQRLQILANTDALTQIPNRRAFDNWLCVAWQEMVQTHQSLTLMLCDIDHFKHYNDTYGHPAGDHCLRQVAQILNHNIRRPTDFVSRYGGEEFAVILTRTTLDAAHHRAEQMRSQISTQTAQSKLPGVTVSIGVACIVPTANRQTPTQLIEAADQALYLSKRRGRDRVTLHESE